tara:strand:- start:706 stop:1695 length:990 start_codon:yes stop_codon:yes gene_type:complete
MFLDLNKITKLTIEASSFCNLHCPQCPRFDSKGFLDKNLTTGHLDFNNIEKNLHLEKLPKLEVVTFEGDYGDPAMNPDLLKFIDFFKDCKKVKLYTNGSIRGKTWFKKLATYKNVETTFSIDGLEDTNHIYRINSNWNKTMDNVKSFIDAGGNAVWKMVVFKHNQHQIEEVRKLSQDLGFQNFEYVLSNRNFYGSNIWPVHVEGEYQYDLEMTTVSDLNIKKKSHTFANDIDNFTSPTCSWIEKGIMYINYLGRLMPCCMTSGTTWKNTISDRLFRKIIGNIDDIDLNINDIGKIAQSDFYQFRLHNSFSSQKTCHNLCLSNCTKKVIG